MDDDSGAKSTEMEHQQQDHQQQHQQQQQPPPPPTSAGPEPINGQPRPLVAGGASTLLQQHAQQQQLLFELHSSQHQTMDGQHSCNRQLLIQEQQRVGADTASAILGQQQMLTQQANDKMGLFGVQIQSLKDLMEQQAAQAQQHVGRQEMRLRECLEAIGAAEKSAGSVLVDCAKQLIAARKEEEDEAARQGGGGEQERLSKASSASKKAEYVMLWATQNTFAATNEKGAVEAALAGGGEDGDGGSVGRGDCSMADAKGAAAAVVAAVQAAGAHDDPVTLAMAEIVRFTRKPRPTVESATLLRV